MSVLIVFESHFGNTSAVATAIASGFADAGVPVVVAHVEEAPDAIPTDVDLLLVGAPTHNMNLPTAATRTKAAELSGSAPGGRGVAEWLAGVQARPGLRVVAFDTTVPGGFSGSAAKGTVKLLGRRGIKAERGESFAVTKAPGPLRDGELERARSWGAGLGGGR